MTTMNVSLSDELRSFVDDQVATGGFASTSEYVRALIRDDRDRDTFRRMLLDGAQSPIEAVADQPYFEGLRRIAGR